MRISFEWDDKKDSANRKKHGIAFEEARTVFVDERADPDHSEMEDRFILMGMSEKLRMLVVCHCYRKNNETIRIISARQATRTEQNQYWKGWKT